MAIEAKFFIFVSDNNIFETNNTINNNYKEKR